MIEGKIKEEIQRTKQRNFKSSGAQTMYDMKFEYLLKNSKSI